MPRRDLADEVARLSAEVAELRAMLKAALGLQTRTLAKVLRRIGEPERPLSMLGTATRATIAARDAAIAAEGVTADAIMTEDRRAATVEARCRVWGRMRDAGVSMAQIGAAFGMDHTTVMHGLRKGGAEFAKSSAKKVCNSPLDGEEAEAQK